MRCASAVALVCVLAAPAQAQYQPWPYYPAWPQVEQPRQQQSPRSERRKAKSQIVYRTRTVTVVKRDTWRGMSQDSAREWLKDQAGEFCRKYPSDEACQRPAQ
jgi:uncharacterized protein with NAD-binding domain and iron-sulfur cluster